MKKLTGFAADQLKELVLEHLQGEALTITTLRLEQLVAKHKRHALDLFESVDVTDSDPFIAAILGSLNLNSSAKSRLLQQSSNLYELLKACNEPHLDRLLVDIDRTNPHSVNKILLATGGLTLGLAALHQQGLLKTLIPTAKALSQQLGSRAFALLSNLKTWPIVSAVLELANLAGNLLSTRRHSKAGVFLQLLQSGFTLGGLLLWSTAATLTPLAAGLLLTSPALKLLHALTGLRQRQTAGASSWPEKAALLRANWQRQEAITAVSTQLLAAFISTASLAAMLFNPAFTLLGLLGFSAAPLLERGLFHRFSETHLNTLQDALRSIDTPPEPTLCPSTKPTAYSLLAQQQRLCQAENNLHHREDVLRQREEAMQTTLVAVEKGYLPQRNQDFSANEEQFIPPQSVLRPQNDDGEEVQPQQQIMR